MTEESLLGMWYGTGLGVNQEPGAALAGGMLGKGQVWRAGMGQEGAGGKSCGVVVGPLLQVPQSCIRGIESYL